MALTLVWVVGHNYVASCCCPLNPTPNLWLFLTHRIKEPFNTKAAHHLSLSLPDVWCPFRKKHMLLPLNVSSVQCHIHLNWMKSFCLWHVYSKISLLFCALLKCKLSSSWQTKYLNHYNSSYWQFMRLWKYIVAKWIIYWENTLHRRMSEAILSSCPSPATWIQHGEDSQFTCLEVLFSSVEDIQYGSCKVCYILWKAPFKKSDNEIVDFFRRWSLITQSVFLSVFISCFSIINTL